MTSAIKNPYAGHRFPPELISYTVWLYLPPSALPFGLRFPLSLRMVEEMLAFRGIEVSYETIRQWRVSRRNDRFYISGQEVENPGGSEWENVPIAHAAVAC